MVSSGLFIKNEKDIQISRIQSIDYNESFIYRIFKLVKLDIRTPGGGLSLDAISKRQALELSDYLHHLKDRLILNERSADSEKEDRDHSEILSESIDRPFSSEKVDRFSLQESETVRVYTMSVRDIIKMNLMGGTFLKGIAVVIGGMELLLEILSADAAYSGFAALLESGWSSVVFFALAIFILIYLAVIVLSVFLNFEYKVERTNDHVTIERGLFSIKSQTISRKNIQSLKKEQNWLQKIFGYASFSVGITSDSQDERSDENLSDLKIGNVVVLPLIKERELNAIIGEMLPDYQLSPAENVVPLRSWRRFVQFPILFCLLLSIAFSFVWPPSWTIGILLSAFLLLYGYYQYKKMGYALSQDEITLEVPGWFTKRTVYLRKERLLNLCVKQNLFLKHSKLGKISVFYAQGPAFHSMELPFLEEDDCARIYDWFVQEEGGAV